jgi:hypothetical protein
MSAVRNWLEAIGLSQYWVAEAVLVSRRPEIYSPP